MKKQMLKEKGITLIALVVTIVVLLILAGVSINLILGNNGLITKTKDAKKKTCIASDEEIIKMAYMYIYYSGKELTAHTLKDQLIEEGKDIETEEISADKIKVIINKCKHAFLVDFSNGQIKYIDEDEIVININPSDIIFTPSTESETTQLTVAISTTNTYSGYVLQYQVGDTIDSSAWQNYSGDINIETNTTIWGRLYNAEEGKEVVNSLKISNVNMSCLHQNGLVNYDNYSHYCPICEYTEAHVFDSSETCDICGYTCYHTESWEAIDEYSHRCSTCCKYYTSHCFDPYTGYCSSCDYTCTHSSFTYSDSSHTCMTCGYEEAHSYEDRNDSGHMCSICGYSGMHSYELSADSYSHICSTCGYEGAHVVGPGGSCELCGYTCLHNFDCGTCTICGYICSHSTWEAINERSHRCVMCGYEESHYFGDFGYCGICNYGEY